LSDEPDELDAFSDDVDFSAGLSDDFSEDDELDDSLLEAEPLLALLADSRLSVR
jgi:hypothetical protein